MRLLEFHFFRLRSQARLLLIAGAVLALIFALVDGTWGGEPATPEIPLASIHVTGNTALSSDELQKTMKLKTPSRVREPALDAAYEQTLNAYRNRGYLKVVVSTELVTNPAGNVWEVRITEGEVYYLGDVAVAGNKEIATNTIKREIEMKRGDVFNQGKLLEGNKRLYSSGCFDLVNMVLTTAPANAVDLVIRVRERDQRFLKGGVGYGAESKERVSLGFEDRNFLGGARRLDVKYTLSGFVTKPEKNRTSLFETSVVQPFIFNTRMEGRVGYEREGKLREAYDSISNTIRASLERRFTSVFSVRGTYRFSGTFLTRVSPDAETPSQTSIDAVGTTFRYDSTDDPFLPNRGWRSITLLEEGMEIFKNDVGFHKFEARLGRFDTIDSGWTFFEGLQFGHIRARSGNTSDIIPIYERYFLGGANSVRGYSERTLGPKDQDGNPLGGTLFLVGNFEVRHRLYRKLFGVVFFDGGNLFAYDPEDATTNVRIHSTGDLQYSSGGGFRLHSPIGAIRLEAGYQLNPEGDPSTLDRIAVHFSIGEVF